MRLSQLALALTLTACATTTPSPTAPNVNPLNSFSFHADRVPVGSVMHFVKSNLDGSKPALVSVYVVDQNDIEVSKSEDGVTDAADITAHLDWKRFSPDHLDSGVLKQDGSRERRVTLDLTGDEVIVRVGDADQRITVSTFPLHIYNFDLMGLNMITPHLRDPRAGFTVSFVEPTFGQSEGLVTLRGRATATFVREETMHGASTYRYLVTGPGLAGAEATLWLNASDGFIEEFESPLPNNPDWQSYKLERRGTVRHMTMDEWQSFKRAHIGRGPESIL